MAQCSLLKKPDHEVKIVDLMAAKRVLAVVDQGLVGGRVGDPEPGRMCVEAAVSFAMGYDHGDDPICVDSDLRSEKIGLNDTDGWKNDKDRAKGLRRVAIAQLGSAGKFNFGQYRKLLAEQLNIICAAQFEKEAKDHRATFARLQKMKIKNYTDLQQAKEIAEDFYRRVEDDYFASEDSVNTSVNAEDVIQSLRDMGFDDSKSLHMTAEMMVTVLKKMKIKGTKYLHLTEKKPKGKKRR